MSEQNLLEQGIHYFNEGQYESAIEALNQALQTNPGLAEGYYLRGVARRRLGDAQGAVEDYTQALQRKPNEEIYCSRASARADLGDHQGAVEDYTQVFQINPLNVEVYVNRGLAYARLGNNIAAIEDCTKALRLNPNYAPAYVNRGLARSNLGDLSGALEDWTHAVENAPENAQAYSNRCFARAELDDYQNALEDCDRALQINSDFDQAYTNRCFVRGQLGDYQGALEDGNRSLQLNPDEPEAYYHRGTARYYLGDHQGGLEDFQKSVELYVQQNRTEDYHYQAALSNIDQVQRGAALTPSVPPVCDLAEITRLLPNPRQTDADNYLRWGTEYFQERQLESSLHYYQQALSLNREIKDEWGEGLAIQRIENIGDVYASQGRDQYFSRQFEAALSYYEEALKIYQDIQNRSGQAHVLYGLGMAYDVFNRSNKAIEYFRQSLEIAREIGDRYRQGRSLSSLGVALYKANGSPQEIDECHKESLIIAQEINDLQGQWLALQNLGNSAVLQGEYERGADFYQQSLEVARAIPDKDGKSQALGNLGATALYQSKYDEALSYLKQALNIAQEIEEWNAIALHLEHMGVALFKAGRLEEARKVLFQSIQKAEENRNHHGKNDANKVSVFDSQTSTYNYLQQVLVAQGKHEAALEVADRGRARAIAELLARRLSPEQQNRANIAPLTIQQIQNIAKEQNATLIEYSITHDIADFTNKEAVDSKLFIWVIQPTGKIDFRPVDLKPFLQGRITSLEKLILNTRRSIGVRGQNAVLARKGTVTEADPVIFSEKLYNILIQPIADLLPSDANERVIFIPHGPLFLVPFAALKDASGKYLIEQHTIVTATSIKVLELTRDHQQRVQAINRKDVLLVGNPTMPEVSFEFGQPPQKLRPLPGAEEEAKEIAPLLNTHARIGDNATKAEIVQRMPFSRIIHLATHGLLDSFKMQEVPGAIALAPSDTDDGLLTAAEIVNLKLSAELVVLSACDTGRGRLTGDGVIGLSRSFISTGVPSVIVSLWSVPDAATASLMVDFYQNLQLGLDKAQALRQAMLSTMHNHPNPLSWAAFTLIGEADSAISFSTANDLKVRRASGHVLNYIATFNEELQQIGQISPQKFAEQFDSKAKYLPQISWDPTTAKFWDEFNLDPEENNNNPNRKNRRDTDFRLNAEELAVFKKNGFVASERLGAKNFTDLFYRIYSNDLPVFISADAILHAWHRSYDAILEELEETYLARSLGEILEGMAQAIPEAFAQYGKGLLNLSLRDVDYFLAVGRSLLTGKIVTTHLNQDVRVTGTIEAAERKQLQEFSLFGRNRKIDFSQFKVRGHYENSKQLQQYFKAMMWCGRIDFRIAGNPEEASPRELGAAAILYNLLKQSGKFEQWQQFDELLQTFVGKTDSMTFAQLGDILEKANIKSPTDITGWSMLEQLQASIVEHQIGVQGIGSDSYGSPKEEEKKVQLPHSFTLMGQKFVLDSWVTSNVVFDRVVWDEKKVQRRIPTALDVAFAALGNDQVVPELVDHMTDTTGHRFRDGLNYQHNLAAARRVVNAQDESVWEENIYMNWLATLRELSSPTTGAEYPEAMQTRAWAMKTVNTQLASWTQLRHDTILYAKQSYTFGLMCYYPAGFVEPQPAFWERFEKMALLSADLIDKIPFPEQPIEIEEEGYKYPVHLQYIKEKQSKFFKDFAHRLAILKEMARKELVQEEFTEAEIRFLRKLVEIQYFGSGGPTYTGWYFSLFYKGHEDSKEWDAIVADVHTDVPDEEIRDPGCVLHQGVGNVDLLMIAVDNGEDKTVYAGPVLSHYEFEMPGVSRKSDSEWRKDIENGQLPPRPDWTKDYFVPSETGSVETDSRFEE